MSHPADLTVYPKILTNKHWQDKKGLMAKGVKTGLGDELKLAEKLHDKIDIAALTVNLGGAKDLEAVQAAYNATVTEYAKSVEPFMRQLETVIANAKRAETELKAEKHKDAARAAANIKDSADTMLDRCSDLDLESPVKAATDQINQNMKLAVDSLKTVIKEMAEGCTAFITGDGSSASWNSNVLQQGRGLSNSVRQIPAYRNEFWSTLQKLKGFDLDMLGLSNDDAKSVLGRKTVAKIAIGIAKDVKAFKPT